MDNQIKSRFFGSYIGCKYQYINPDFPKMTPAIFTNCGLIEDDGNYRVRNENGFNKQAFEDCQLILRPLPSITDEEAIAALTKATGLYLCDVDRNEDRIVAVGVNHSSCAVIWLKISVNQSGTFIQAWNDIKGHSQPDCHDYLAVDYLRSLNFCLPFNSIDPIEAGWAILETVNQPTGANNQE